LLKESEFANLVFDYITYFGDNQVKKEETDFETKKKFYEYQRNLMYITLNGEKVKSEAERTIMNFYLSHKLNGAWINIKYEVPAAWMAENGKVGSGLPKPDFFFPELGIYLEHWALNKKGEVPVWFEKSSAEYKKAMEIKKKNFALQKEYALFETFSYECMDSQKFLELLSNRLIATLKSKFPDKGFVIERMPYEELVEKVWVDCKGAVKRIHQDISTFIVFAKNYELSIDEIRKRLAELKLSEKQKVFTKIALEVYSCYKKELRKIEEIDFNDMINISKKELLEKNAILKDTYDQILIDEFQDISQKRFELIKALLEKNQGCKLFCVGDDWQSIMGFSGANVDLFVNFEKYFKPTEVTKLDTNYRSRKEIVDLGAKIIEKNGASQIKKNLVSAIRGDAEILLVSSQFYRAVDYCEQTSLHCIEKIEELLTNGYSPADIMILYRAKNGYLRESLHRLAKGKKIKIVEKGGQGVQLMTIHKSKGLQAKVVFVLNLIDDLYGLPCKVENPDVLEIVNDGNYSKEQEERRLFYVAVTRAQEKLYIYTKSNAKSQFLKELGENIPEKILPLC